MKKGLKTLVSLGLAMSFVFGISSCKKDEEDEPNNTKNDPSNLVEVTASEITGKWKTSNWYYLFSEGGTGEEGSVSSISGEEKEGDITWEITSCELDVVDAATGDISTKQVRCIKVTDVEGYYTELEVLKEGESITLKDHDNNVSYTKEGSNNGGSGSIIDGYEPIDFARIWYNDSWTDSVYYRLKEDYTGSCLDASAERYNVTWEFAIISIDEVSQTGDITTIEKPGIKVTDPEGYYVELYWEEDQEQVDSIYDTSLNRWFVKIKNEYDDPEFISNVPGRIEMENYAKGVEGETYHNLTTYNNAGQGYRYGSVDLKKDESLSNGHALRDVRSGEWLKYAVNVEESGIYGVKMHLSCSYHSSFGDGMNAYVIVGSDSTKLNIRNNGNTYMDYTMEGAIYLYATSGDPEMIKVAFEGDDATFIIDYMEINQDFATATYSWEDFYNKKYSNGDQYIEFEYNQNSGFTQQGHFYVNGESSDFPYNDESKITICKIRHNGYPDSESHVGQVIVANLNPSGIKEKGVFEIVDENTLKYIGGMNSYSEYNGGADHMVDPVILTLEQ
jgi:hypothetical protein